MPTLDQTAIPDWEGLVSEELRSSPRNPYPYRQKIASMRSDQMPSEEDFFEVDCCDLSGGGMSFCLDDRPEFEDLVVALGRPPLVMHFSARVVHVAPVDRECGTVCRVGCRFQQRVHL